MRKFEKNDKDRNFSMHGSIHLSKYFSSPPESWTRKRSLQPSIDAAGAAKSSKTSVDNSPKESSSECVEKSLIEPGSLTSSHVSQADNSKLSCFLYKKIEKGKGIDKRKLVELEKAETISSEFESLKSILDDERDSDQAISDCDSASKTAIKYTPLEKQYLEFQRKYPTAVLMIECGYMYRFFGKDAEIAKRDLNIGCFQYHNFVSASVPAHRLYFHVRRLVVKGHKVAVIKQTESAALKAIGDSRNELFARELHAMYTRSTFIEEEVPGFNDEIYVEVETCDDNDAGSGFLMCIYEMETYMKQKNLNCVSLAFVAIEVSSGDVFYSILQSGSIHPEFENCLSSLNPLEILVPSSPLSRNTEKVLEAFIHDRSVRLEKLDEKLFDPSFALRSVSNLISSGNSEQTSDVQENLQSLVSLPPLVISCLSALKEYLADFKVDHILRNVKNFRPYSDCDNMILNAATLRGLEILQTNCHPRHVGSLFWSLNQTQTKFGGRMLKSWIIKPLNNIQKIEERLNIITEIMHSESVIFKKISQLLSKLPDLERLLCSAFYHKCSCKDILKLLTSLSKIQREIVGLSDWIESKIETPKLKIILYNIMDCLRGVDVFVSNIDPDAARSGNKVNLFLDTTNYYSLESCKSKIVSIEEKLNSLRPSICEVLRLPAVKYTTVTGQRFLIEVHNSHQSLVPDDWLKMSMTKQTSRYRSPEIIQLCKELEQEEARLEEYAKAAWHEFLDDFGKEFHKFKRCISHLAELDCYLSLAKVSKNESYSRPYLTDSENRNFEILRGYHPMVSKLMGEDKQFVTNDLKMNHTRRCLIVTGPNMGGKSTYIRQVALVAIMAHIGCYVPAESATIPLVDGIYVRMGAEDDIVSRKSTFMVEMSEASQILSSATSRSLVIFDELGRGTSSNDGAAIAYATLKYLVEEVRCFNLFVTHYPPVVELKEVFPENIGTVHMSYILQNMENEDDIQRVIFLYSVVDGISQSSYGINVASLAGIPKQILTEAQTMSRKMEMITKIQRQLQRILQKLQATPELSPCVNLLHTL